MMSKKVAVVAFRCTVIQLFGAKNEKIAVEPEESVKDSAVLRLESRRF
jgi:hypothetical protein